MSWADLFKHPDDKHKKLSKLKKKHNSKVYQKFKEEQKKDVKIKKISSIEFKKSIPSKKINTLEVVVNNSTAKNFSDISKKYFDIMKKNLGSSLLQGITIDRKSKKIIYIHNLNQDYKILETLEIKINLFEDVSYPLDDFIIMGVKEEKILYFQKFPEINLLALIKKDISSMDYIFKILANKLKTIKK